MNGNVGSPFLGDLIKKRGIYYTIPTSITIVSYKNDISYTLFTLMPIIAKILGLEK